MAETEDGFLTFEGVLERMHFAEFSAVSVKAFSGRGRGAGILFLVAVFVATLGFLKWTDQVAVPIDPEAAFGPRELVLVALATGMLMALVLTWVMSCSINAAFRSGALRDGGSYLGPRRYTLTSDGVEIAGAHGRSLTRWSAIMKMTETPHTYLVWTDPGAAVMVPKDAFARSDLTAEAFHAFVEKKIAEHGATAARA